MSSGTSEYLFLQIFGVSHLDFHTCMGLRKEVEFTKPQFPQHHMTKSSISKLPSFSEGNLLLHDLGTHLYA